MSHCQKLLLDDRAVIAVSGEDASHFLQGLVTSNITHVSDGTAIYAALLIPQGKILFDFFIASDGKGGYLFDCLAEQAAELAKRLTFYKLRAKVEIAARPELRVAALFGDVPEPLDLPDGVIAFPDPRLAALGTRVILDADDFAALPGEAASQADYDSLRIAHGVPAGGQDFQYGGTFPHEALLDQLGGVDFTKGCFIGQEVVSRMEHRGTARKRIVPVSADADLPEPGTEISADGAPIGTLGSVSGRSGLALIRLDRAGDAISKDKPLMAGDVAISLAKPDWARFAIPTEAA
ncbi:folate-binding protein YgfZ [Methyloligella sp. 2.7D]|uniref:CAF17-like 4Fe-4S cluster assembly/insertion protein YgfZ n=1 Tax=unclassified Methyloligella TaxID=2625955 RepID=UPI00157CC31C|nr:folate-binding protein YgfZ [Methyloligella sp. GL2]QKP78275.1 folate-binding protein YgfZ [Methyloligella sp. GL2]